MKRKVKTTATRKPNKNQQEKQRKKETPRLKTISVKYEEQKNQTAESESNLDLRRGCQESGLKERSKNKERKWGNQDRAKKQARMESQKRLMKEEKKHGILKGNIMEKEETTKNEKQRRVLKKGLRGKKRAKHLSNCRTQLLCIRDSKTCCKKTPELQGKRRYWSYIFNQTTDIRKRKAKPTKKRNTNEEHKYNQDINDWKTRRPKTTGIWVSKGDVREMCLKESSQTE